ncbi:uncharacterized protein LOC118428200 isoform X2 [Branchiostoma floridae]|uniref:Uncharacterized protein LOC118428200 isoform X2 n=1 Tax=Branchiostoma floridae TaxID=7739 RepID=A0A9J7M4D8_BRAFL|nr:uncharacterized protein LOC118428200 isoform X2 [Branchiostoma floridae]
MLRIRSVFPCSKNPENRHRSRRGRPRPEFRKLPKKNAAPIMHNIGPGFVIPRYKRANYPDELLLQNPDTAPPKRPIYDNFHYPTKHVPKHVLKPANWTSILREINRLWKLSRSFHLEQIRKRAEKSRAISEQDHTNHDDDDEPDFEVSAHGQAPRKTRSCPVSPLRTTKKVYRNTKPWIP